jgi:hypothetical protein
MKKLLIPFLLFTMISSVIAQEMCFPEVLTLNDGAFGSLPPGKEKEVSPLRGRNVPYMEAHTVRASDDPAEIYTVGLNPCVAVLYKLESEDGRPLGTCMTHMGYNGTGNGPSNEELFTENHLNCVNQLNALGERGNLKVLVHGKIGPSESPTTDQDRVAQRNAGNILAVLAQRPEVSGVSEVYDSSAQYRSLHYNLLTGAVKIYDEVGYGIVKELSF